MMSIENYMEVIKMDKDKRKHELNKEPKRRLIDWIINKEEQVERIMEMRKRRLVVMYGGPYVLNNEERKVVQAIIESQLEYYHRNLLRQMRILSNHKKCTKMLSLVKECELTPKRWKNDI